MSVFHGNVIVVFVIVSATNSWTRSIFLLIASNPYYLHFDASKVWFTSPLHTGAAPRTAFFFWQALPFLKSKCLQRVCCLFVMMWLLPPWSEDRECDAQMCANGERVRLLCVSVCRTHFLLLILLFRHSVCVLCWQWRRWRQSTADSGMCTEYWRLSG